jgi:hypothetical protein
MAFYERAVRHAEVLCAPERAEAFEGLSTEAYTEGRAEPALDARRSARSSCWPPTWARTANP